MRFALAMALGAVGGAASLPFLRGLLEDPFAQRESAEAASLIALRTGQQDQVLAFLGEPGLGSPWRWGPRARLGDGAWGAAVAEAWATLSPPLRIQALDAARLLPGVVRSALKQRLRSVAERSGGQAQKLWEGL
jgi:hypothetical protein